MASKWFWQRSIDSLFGFFVLCLLSSFPPARADLDQRRIGKWSETFGQTIYDLCARATALEDIRTDYILMDQVTVKSVDGSALVQDMKLKIEGMLRQKRMAVQKLVKAAEEAQAVHSPDHLLETSEYHMSKRLNMTLFPLEENQHFNYAEVNMAMSTVHVPTNIFDESVVILNGIAWSKVLDETFVSNHDNDSTLTWQYFCSTTGFLRSFPGAPWQTENYNSEQKLDVFDCRSRGWYIEAAAYPKDVVILLDSSGSMKGLRSVVAQATVVKILDTLGYDDFVNVITYSETAEYLDPCFNATMVQATEANKKRLKDALSSVKALNIANLDLALTAAFELLRAINESRKGALCNKVIMIVSDGAGDAYENIFQKYNWPSLEVRIFTYLIGREVRDSKNVMWMACRNKGRLSRISSLADAHEHVQSYIHVLSRPMAIRRALHPVWSNVYVDALEPGLQLMTTVAQPVFDARPGKLHQQTLIGVVGTDVPLTELMKLTPPYLLGAHGYSFAITNNGYVLFHPKLLSRLNPHMKKSLAIDIADFELLDINSTLRNKMVDRQTDTLKMKSIFTSDQKRRGIVREYNYFITDIAETPFSLAIALPQDGGLFRVDGTRPLKTADLQAFTTSEVLLAPWNYCTMETNETKRPAVEMLMKYLTRAKDDATFYKQRCDVDLISSLLFDVEATRDAAVNWRKNDYDDIDNTTTRSIRNGVEMVFLGTKSGFTRYLYFDPSSSPPDPSFILARSSTTEETYYSRAVDNGEGIFTISVPFKDDKDEKTASVVTASTPLTIGSDDKEAVAAVLGLRMNYSKFYELFLNSTRNCPARELNCAEGCASSDYSCYLLDENGYIVLSKEEGEVGKFFGELEGMGAIMNEMISEESDDSSKEEGVYLDGAVFRRIRMIDYHALCDVYNNGRSSSSSSAIVEPLRQILSSLVNILHEVFLFFLQFHFVNWFFYKGVRGDFEINTGVGSYKDLNTSADSSDYIQFYEGLEYWDKTVSDMMLECATIISDSKPRSQQKWQQVKDCFDNIRLKTSPRFVGTRPCVKMHHYYVANATHLPQQGTVTSCRGKEDECRNTYSINRIPGTNLMLLVVDTKKCSCKQEPPVSSEPFEIIYNETYTCQRLQQEVYRKRPQGCYAQSNEEDYSDCGLGNKIEPTTTALLTLLFTSYVVAEFGLIT